ncbi:hypothetical protein ACWGIN_05330 [Streptomyces sp. NPDC054861]
MTDADEVSPETVPPAEPRGRGRTLLTLVLPCVLVLGAIGGGVTYTGVTVASADRSAPTVAWERGTSSAQPDPAEYALRGKTSTPLSKLLLPVPEGYVLGPDIESYGNDGELGEKEATALVKQEGKGLSGKKRREYEKRVDRLGIQGIAVRSFAAEMSGIVMNVHITRMKDKKRIREMFELRKEVADFLKFPKGPKITGHRNAVCYGMPQSKEGTKAEREKLLDGMVCVAYDSEVLVTVRATGVRPFAKSAVARLTKQQLDHIKSPGEYV